MANVQHSALTDPNIHEPKGIASASVGEVYVADGAGSGAWETIAGHSYGDLYISNNSTSFTLAAASALTKLNPSSAWVANGYQNITPSAADAQFTITRSGVYQLNFWIVFQTAAIASGAAYNFHYNVSGTSSTRKVYVTKPTNNVDTLHVASNGYVTLTAGQTISIYVGGDGTSSGTAIVVKEAGLNCLLIDPA